MWNASSIIYQNDWDHFNESNAILYHWYIDKGNPCVKYQIPNGSPPEILNYNMNQLINR